MISADLLVLGALDLQTGKARYLTPGGPLFCALSRTRGQLLIHNGFLNEVSFSPNLLGKPDDSEPDDGVPDRVPDGAAPSDGGPAAGEGATSEVDATSQKLCTTPAKFRTPCLLDDVAAAFVEADGSLVAVDLATDTRTVLHTLTPGGETLLVGSRDGAKLLVVHQTVTGDAVDLKLLLLHAPTPADLAAGRHKLHVLECAPNTASICAFFAPDSSKLLCLDAALRGADGEAAGGRDNIEDGGMARGAWSVWTLGDTPADPPSRQGYDPFVPSVHFLRSIIPFFDQYALVHSPWSPDSTSFCYADASGAVRVQRLDGPAAGDASRSALAAQLGMEQLAPSAEAVDCPASADLVLWSPC